MFKVGRMLRGVFAAVGMVGWCGAVWAVPAGQAAPVSEDLRHARRWVHENADNGTLPYAIVDKKAAMLQVFSADGRLVGSSPVLVGLAPGDDSAPGIGRMAQSHVPPALRTTPAGRFESEPGRNLQGEDIVWVDYQAAFAIHRLRPGADRRNRLRRLASASPADNRASLGCVVVPEPFYDNVVQPTLGRQRGVVYVLPETRPVQALFHTAQTLAE